MAAHALSFEMREMRCGACGIVFWAPEFFMDQREKDGNVWHCPNGHRRVYRETTADKLRKELEVERQHSAMERQLRIDTESRLKKAQREQKRIKTRIQAGVCPDCNRTFQNLARHMECKHHVNKVSA
jgi:NMD protein affecting ribosome stability and mRNA decay